VENFNKSLKKAISVATIERKNWKEELNNVTSIVGDQNP
jgi:hypothetical protein